MSNSEAWINGEVSHFNNNYVNLYNNEIIGCIGIYSVTKHMKSISSAKALLILPMVFQNDLLSYMGRSNVDVKSIEQLILRKPDLLSNFNERFYSLLQVSVNSILILNALNFLTINPDGKIELLGERDFIPSYEKEEIGKRAFQIINVSYKVAKLLEDKVENLYLQLRVKL
ncbi:three component ABC system middle component [Bacillus sp. CFBP9009]